MDIFMLAFIQLMREGKAKIVNHIPIYKGSDLLDYAIKIRNYLVREK